jgi:hypothetical protein
MDDKKIMKLAEDVPGILHASSQHLRKMAGKLITETQRADAAEQELHRMKLARRMELRNMEPNLSFEEKVAALAEVPSEKLASLEQAVELAAGGVTLARLNQEDGQKVASQGGELYSSEGGDALEDFVMSNQAFD